MYSMGGVVDTTNLSPLHLPPARARETPTVLVGWSPPQSFNRLLLCLYCSGKHLGRCESCRARRRPRRRARRETRNDEAVQETADECAARCYEDRVEIVEAAGEAEEGVAATAPQVVVLCTAACYDEAEEAMEEAGEDGFVLEELDGAVVAQGELET